MTLTDQSGQQSCRPSPCGPTSCRNGGVCQATSVDSFRCRCQEGFRGQRCELGQVRGHHLAALSPSSILAISMCLLVFLGENWINSFPANLCNSRSLINNLVSSRLAPTPASPAEANAASGLPVSACV